MGKNFAQHLEGGRGMITTFIIITLAAYALIRLIKNAHTIKTQNDELLRAARYPTQLQEPCASPISRYDYPVGGGSDGRKLRANETPVPIPTLRHSPNNSHRPDAKAYKSDNISNRRVVQPRSHNGIARREKGKK